MACHFAGRWITQSDPAALVEVPFPEALPTATDEPDPPGDTVVVPETPPAPVVIDVEVEPPCLPVTTRQGLPFTIVVPFGPEVTATLSASAGAVVAKHPISITAVLTRMEIPPRAEVSRSMPRGGERVLHGKRG
jgi:hypothetical protein